MDLSQKYSASAAHNHRELDRGKLRFFARLNAAYLEWELKNLQEG
jgi:hypothetical protein